MQVVILIVCFIRPMLSVLPLLRVTNRPDRQLTRPSRLWCELAHTASNYCAKASVWGGIMTSFEQMDPPAAIERRERGFDPDRFA